MDDETRERLEAHQRACEMAKWVALGQDHHLGRVRAENEAVWDHGFEAGYEAAYGELEMKLIEAKAEFLSWFQAKANQDDNYGRHISEMREAWVAAAQWVLGGVEP